MVACPTSRSVRYFSLPWAPALGRAGRCFDTGEALRSAGAATSASYLARRAAPITSCAP